MNTAIEKLHFASDYMEGAHPQVLDAIVRTNSLSTVGYGEDNFCKRAEQEILAACNCSDGEVHFLIGGTQANAVVIDALLRPYQGVIAAASGHVSVHEAGAIEYGGHKVLVAKDHEGKIMRESSVRTASVKLRKTGRMTQTGNIWSCRVWSIFPSQQNTVPCTL